MIVLGSITCSPNTWENFFCPKGLANSCGKDEKCGNKHNKQHDYDKTKQIKYSCFFLNFLKLSIQISSPFVLLSPLEPFWFFFMHLWFIWMSCNIVSLWNGVGCHSLLCRQVHSCKWILLLDSSFLWMLAKGDEKFG